MLSNSTIRQSVRGRQFPRQTDDVSLLLILTSIEDATADYLCGLLPAQDVAFLRLDTETFTETGFVEYGIEGATLWYAGRSYSPDAFSAVWYRRPRGVSIRGQFSAAHRLHASREWGASLDGFLAHIDASRWINHPAANARASNKLLQLSMARQGGLAVPETLMSRSIEEARLFFQRHNGRVVLKPLSVGYVEAPDGTLEAQIYTSMLRQEHLYDARLLEQCPTLLQQQIAKVEDVRITIIDDFVTAIGLSPRDGHAPVDIRETDPRQIVYTEVPLPSDTCTQVLHLVKRLGLRFAAVDMIRSEGNQWVFLEINPNGQWAWMDLLGGSKIASGFIAVFRDTMVNIAISRVTQSPPAHA